jgi:hypothetical protein
MTPPRRPPAPDEVGLAPRRRQPPADRAGASVWHPAQARAGELMMKLPMAGPAGYTCPVETGYRPKLVHRLGFIFLKNSSLSIPGITLNVKNSSKFIEKS